MNGLPPRPELTSAEIIEHLRGELGHLEAITAAGREVLGGLRVIRLANEEATMAAVELAPIIARAGLDPDAGELLSRVLRLTKAIQSAHLRALTAADDAAAATRARIVTLAPLYGVELP